MKKSFVLVGMMMLLVGCGVNYHGVKTFVEPNDPVRLSVTEEAAWKYVKKHLNGAWGSVDCNYARGKVPVALGVDVYPMVAWKGERVASKEKNALKDL